MTAQHATPTPPACGDSQPAGNYNLGLVEEIRVETMAGAEAYIAADQAEDRTVDQLLALLRRRCRRDARAMRLVDELASKVARLDMREERTVITMAAEDVALTERLERRMARQKATV